MIAFLALLLVGFGVAVVLATLAILLKLVLLPVRLAFGLAKLMSAAAVGIALLIVGLPFALILLFPLILVGVAVWGMVRLMAA